MSDSAQLGDGRPWVIAHRGASGNAPENTHAAFEAALAAGADGVELDVQLSADGVPVVYHDKTLAKVGGPRRRIGELDVDALQQLDVGRWYHRRFAGQRMPTLDEVLERYGTRTRLMIEIKVDAEASGSSRVRALTDAVVSAVLARGARVQPHLLSFSPEVITRIRRRAPSLPCVLDYDARPVGGALPRLAGAHILCLPARFATAWLGRALRVRRRALWVYRCDTAFSLAAARRAGASAIITDDPQWARSALASLFSRPIPSSMTVPKALLVSDDGDYAAALNALPDGYNAVMGIRFVRANGDEVELELAIAASHRQPYGLVHGGVYSGLVETAASVGAGLHAMSQGLNVVGLENHTSFLHAVRQGTLRALAQPLSRGRRTHVWEVVVRDEQGRSVAKGRVRLLVLDPGTSLGGRQVGYVPSGEGTEEEST